MSDYHADFFFKRKRIYLDVWYNGRVVAQEYDRPCYPCSDCQYWQHMASWKRDSVCFRCRESRQTSVRTTPEKAPKCPSCGVRMHLLSSRIRIPRKHQVKHWMRLERALLSARDQREERRRARAR